MDEKQIKIKIFLIRTLDWALVIIAMMPAFIAFQNEENRFLVAVLGLVGLAIVRRIGVWSLQKVHSLRVDLDRLRKTERLLR